MRSMILLLVIFFVQTVPALGGEMKADEQQTYAFFYFMKGDQDAVMQAVPLHVEYWKALQPDGFQGGPFADHSGGMVVFRADNEESALDIVQQDPFMQRRVIGDHWLKGWQIHE